LAGYILSLLAGPKCALYLAPENPIHHRLALEARIRWHRLHPQLKPELIPASSTAMRQIARALARGSNLLMYVDEQRGDYIMAPSLGRVIPRAGNRWLTARLAVQHEADIVPVYVEPMGHARYRINIAPKLTPGEGDASTRALALSEQMDRCFDAWVRKHIDHWYWFPDFDPEKLPP
jgi:lauroyl/myristoyl acyltransferase